MRGVGWILLALAGCAADQGLAGDAGFAPDAELDAGEADAGGVDCGRAPTFTELHDGIFATPRCANRFCHAPGVETGGLNLSGGKAVAHRELLVEATTATVSFSRRVVPGQADESYLVIKVSSPDPGGEEGRMPPGQPLDVCQISGIRLWIEGGAMND